MERTVEQFSRALIESRAATIAGYVERIAPFPDNIVRVRMLLEFNDGGEAQIEIKTLSLLDNTGYYSGSISLLGKDRDDPGDEPADGSHG